MVHNHWPLFPLSCITVGYPTSNQEVVKNTCNVFAKTRAQMATQQQQRSLFLAQLWGEVDLWWGYLSPLLYALWATECIYRIPLALEVGQEEGIKVPERTLIKTSAMMKGCCVKNVKLTAFGRKKHRSLTDAKGLWQEMYNGLESGIRLRSGHSWRFCGHRYSEIKRQAHLAHSKTRTTIQIVCQNKKMVSNP